MMTNTEPIVNPAARYSIEETCKLLSIHRNSLRKYTAEGRIKAGIRKSTGRRFYLGSEISKFWQRQL
ncbi:MAG: helix-turn-helix domain-containing protein [Treponema sp.]|nr:helix-turn-helix domain-containing protein [Treponema sp.]